MYKKITNLIIIIIIIIIIIASPLFVNKYVIFFSSHTTANYEDLWNYSAAILTAIIAGAFIIYQITYQKNEKENEYRLNNRTELDFSFTRADITDEDAYLFCEDFYINSLKKNGKLESLKDVYLKPKHIPPAFKIECYKKSATNIKIHYDFKSDGGNINAQTVNLGNLSQGQSKYFVLFDIMRFVTDDNNHEMDKFGQLVPDVEYFPKNILDNKIIITFKNITGEKGALIYNFEILDKSFKNIESIVSQVSDTFFEHDYDTEFPSYLFHKDKKNDTITKNNSYKKQKTSTLVKLTSRLLLS